MFFLSCYILFVGRWRARKYLVLIPLGSRHHSLKRRIRTHQMLTQAELKATLSYDPDTGVFTRVHTLHSRYIGKPAGAPNNKGYITIRVNGKTHKAHRLAFLYMLGSFPEKQVDHINGIKDDNRWCNLREAENYQNCQNRKLRCDNTSGFRGVSWNKSHRRWQASIMANNVPFYIGQFDTPEEAHKAYLEASSVLHNDFSYQGLVAP